MYCMIPILYGNVQIGKSPQKQKVDQWLAARGGANREHVGDCLQIKASFSGEQNIMKLEIMVMVAQLFKYIKNCTLHYKRVNVLVYKMYIFFSLERKRWGQGNQNSAHEPYISNTYIRKIVCVIFAQCLRRFWVLQSRNSVNV